MTRSVTVFSKADNRTDNRQGFTASRYGCLVNPL